MFNLFAKYGLVGIFNTLLHWAVFLCLFYLLSQTQAISNLIAFAVAVTFSFFVNARFTFQCRASLQRYLLYVSFMGAISWAFGAYADGKNINPMITMVAFSGLSFVLGFIYSKYIVFRKSPK